MIAIPFWHRKQRAAEKKRIENNQARELKRLALRCDALVLELDEQNRGIAELKTTLFAERAEMEAMVWANADLRGKLANARRALDMMVKK